MDGLSHDETEEQLRKINETLKSIQTELRCSNELFFKILERLGASDTERSVRRHGHCLTDDNLLDLLSRGMTTPEIADWTEKQGFRYSTPGLRKRINKLVSEGKTTYDGKAKIRKGRLVVHTGREVAG